MSLKTIKKVTALFMTVAIVAAFSAISEPIVADATTTKEQIDQKEKEKNNIQGELNKTNENLEDLKENQNSLKGELNHFNNELLKVRDNLEELEGQIRNKEQEIDNTQALLENARETEKWQKKCMVARARDMYVRSSDSYINAVVTADSFASMLNTQDYFQKIAEYDQQKMQEFKENRELIEETETRLLGEMEELEQLKDAAEEEKNKVSSLISATSSSIAKYADQISDAEQEARAYEEQLRKTEEDLTYLRQKLKEELAMSQTAANATWRDISEVTFEEGDRYLLANLIYCEAGAEPYDGKVAVGSVVINRVLSSVYPDTVLGVIYQNRQFTPAGSGRLAIALNENRANADCYRAADEAMSGVTNVGNCVYFRTPIEGLSGINIGGHVFY
ncbi:MAG: cell wall hydrolase [Bacteroidales bacterium]|nr:cell wall hydrolase [Lachnoclostridium sp.]MCM1383841.1 cell wall hydrolase [Lachnoclostridium sp.]MCM1464506.1 cell wall hydrolase [Bacteroidales bacterium]